MALLKVLVVLASTFLSSCHGENSTFQLEADMCQVFTVIESPVLIDTFISSNTVLTPGHGCTISIQNAPTSLVTTVTITATVTSEIILPIVAKCALSPPQLLWYHVDFRIVLH